MQPSRCFTSEVSRELAQRQHADRHVVQRPIAQGERIDFAVQHFGLLTAGKGAFETSLSTSLRAPCAKSVSSSSSDPPVSMKKVTSVLLLTRTFTTGNGSLL